MFRDAISKLSLRKKLTILAFVGVLLPVMVLTYLQYRSLAELESKTKGAFKDNLRQGFTILQRQMKQNDYETHRYVNHHVSALDPLHDVSPERRHRPRV